MSGDQRIKCAFYCSVCNSRLEADLFGYDMVHIKPCYNCLCKESEDGYDIGYDDGSRGGEY